MAIDRKEEAIRLINEYESNSYVIIEKEFYNIFQLL